MASRRQQPRYERKERSAELLDRLMREHRVRFLRQARLHSERGQDAEDALGDACVQFLLHFEGRDEEQARRWLLVVVKRCAWAITRRRGERRAVAEEVPADPSEVDDSVDVIDERRGPAELAQAREEAAELVAALERLKADERRAVILHALGLSYLEIGAMSNWTRTKVNRSLVEGRARLRQVLAGRGENS